MPANVGVRFEPDNKDLNAAIQESALLWQRSFATIGKEALAQFEGIAKQQREWGAVAANEEATQRKKKQSDEKATEEAIARDTKTIRETAIAEMNALRDKFTTGANANEKKAAKAIVAEIEGIMEIFQANKLALANETLNKAERAEIASEQKRLSARRAVMTTIALENERIAKHGEGVSVGILGTGRHIEAVYGKVGSAITKWGGGIAAAGVGMFTIDGLLNTATASAHTLKEQTDGIAHALAGSKISAEELPAAVADTLQHAADFGDRMNIARESVRDVAATITGVTGLTGQAAKQATELAFAYKESSNGILTAEKFSQLLNKSIGDPENEKALQVLESKYPGISAEMARATSAQEKLNVLQQHAAPVLEQMAEEAQEFGDRAEVAFRNIGEMTGSVVEGTLNIASPLATAAVGFVSLSGAVKGTTFMTKAHTAATKLHQMAQHHLNLTMLKNPIFLAVAGLTALVTGVVLAYKHSETFRNILDTVWASIKTGITFWAKWLNPIGLMVQGIKALYDRFEGLRNIIDSVGGFLGGLIGISKEEESATKRIVTEKEREAQARAAAANEIKRQKEQLAGLLTQYDQEKKQAEEKLKNLQGQYAMFERMHHDHQITDAQWKEYQAMILKAATWRAEFLKQDAASQQAFAIKSGQKEDKDAETAAKKKLDTIKKNLKAEEDAKRAQFEIDMERTNADEMERYMALVELEKGFHSERRAKLAGYKDELAEVESQWAAKQAALLLEELKVRAKVVDTIAGNDKDNAQRINETLASLNEERRTMTGLSRQEELAEVSTWMQQMEIEWQGHEDVLTALHDVASARRTAINAKFDKAEEDRIAKRNQAIDEEVKRYGDILSALLALNEIEHKRDEDADNALKNELLRMDQIAEAQARYAKDERSAHRIRMTGEAQRIEMIRKRDQEEAATAAFERNRRNQAEVEKILGFKLTLKEFALAKGKEAAIYLATELQKAAADKGSMLAAIETTAIKVGASLQAAAASILEGAASVIKWLVSLGPWMWAAIPAGLAGLYGVWAGAKSALGFQSGGWTGEGEDDEPAGVVHKNEFVVHAKAAKKNRALLEFINAKGYERGGMVGDGPDKSWSLHLASTSDETLANMNKWRDMFKFYSLHLASTSDETATKRPGLYMSGGTPVSAQMIAQDLNGIRAEIRELKAQKTLVIDSKRQRLSKHKSDQLVSRQRI